jgi:hypothetical protein
MQEVFRTEIQFESKLCVWSKFEVIDKYERIIKVDELSIILHVYA